MGASTFGRNIIITLWKPYYVGCLKKSICQKRMLPVWLERISAFICLDLNRDTKRGNAPGKIMSDLIVVCFKDEFTADEVLLDLGKLELEYYLE